MIGFIVMGSIITFVVLAVMGECRQWGYGTFPQFLREFESRKWRRSLEFPTSYFDSQRPSWNAESSEVHASIVRFGGKGMVLYPWSYPAFQIWLWRNRMRPEDRKTVNWGQS